MDENEIVTALAPFTSDQLLGEWSRRNNLALESWYAEMNSPANQQKLDQQLSELAAGMPVSTEGTLGII